jgi:hypothetical protein
MIGITAAENIAISPATLYQIATADTVNPLSKVDQAINLSLVCILMS